MTAQSVLEKISRHQKLWILTGAGLSAASGLPTYRNDAGDWQAATPVQHQDFINRPESRQQYWARSMFGWPAFKQASPNEAHLALARLQQLGCVHQLVTQNVDRLHSQAGNLNVIDLHGRLDRVVCLNCGAQISRDAMQTRLRGANPDQIDTDIQLLPDGDASVTRSYTEQLKVPDCERCGGTLKPDVVFFGDNVPGERVAHAYTTLAEADAALFIGSSLQVMSGYRFCVHASKQDIPLYCINRGKTRADTLFDAKLSTDLSEALIRLTGIVSGRNTLSQNPAD